VNDPVRLLGMAVRPRRDLAVGLVLLVAVVARLVSHDDRVDDTIYVAVLTAAAVAAWVGAQRGPLERRPVGRLVAGGLALTALGDALWVVLDALGRQTDVSVADLAWFAAYSLLAAALFVVLRASGAGRQDVDFTLDAATIVVVSVLALWSLSVDAILTESDVSPATRAVWSAYPVVDAILLALVLRVLTSRTARSYLDPSFAVGTVLWLAADLGYLTSPQGVAREVMDATWMVAPVLLARGTWLYEDAPEPPPATPERGHRVRQLAIAFTPLLVPPLLELANHLRGRSHTPYALATGSVALIGLAFGRAARLVRSEQRALRDLEQARDDALEAYRAKSMFLATMSHEIRTPLTTVLGAAEILEDTPLDDGQRDLVRRVRRSGGVLRTMVDTVLDYSRLEAGQQAVTTEAVDLARLVRTLVGTYGPVAEERGLVLACDLDPALPAAVVGDHARLLQLLGNLVDNALKFTHEGRVDVSVRPAGGNVVEYVVEDTGIGIPREHLASVFDTFTQVDSSTTRRYGGTGLGLAICREVIELMGGSLEVRSRVGTGSTFVVRLSQPPAATLGLTAPAGAP
jgi:signal transduction histidine kinase